MYFPHIDPGILNLEVGGGLVLGSAREGKGCKLGDSEPRLSF